MGNLEAVKEWRTWWNDLESGACDKMPLATKEMIREIIVEAFQAYEHTPPAPVPEPKPLKLEAGCRVTHFVDSILTESVVLTMSERFAWLRYERMVGVFRTFHISQLTVIEAATPGVGDYVLEGNGQVGVILADNRLGTYVYMPKSKSCRYLDRYQFTILHKAPKEEA